MPYMFCNIQNVCTYASRTAVSYWLSTEHPIPMMPVQGEELKNYVSRCAVCLAPAPLLTVHSQSVQQAGCPEGWSDLWQGYSFVMVSVLENTLHVSIFLVISPFIHVMTSTLFVI